MLGKNPSPLLGRVVQSAAREPAPMAPRVVRVVVVVVATLPEDGVHQTLVHRFACLGVLRGIRARSNDCAIGRLVSFRFQTLGSRNDGRPLGSPQDALRPTLCVAVLPWKPVWVAVEFIKELFDRCARGVVAFRMSRAHKLRLGRVASI